MVLACLDELHEGNATGIYVLRRLKFKRCGELALRISSRLTFALGISQPVRKVGISKKNHPFIMLWQGTKWLLGHCSDMLHHYSEGILFGQPPIFVLLVSTTMPTAL